eukprot:SAG22_NODE_1639_length_3911_cov_21.500787_4_plen_190_part_00
MVAGPDADCRGAEPAPSHEVRRHARSQPVRPFRPLPPPPLSNRCLRKQLDIILLWLGLSVVLSSGMVTVWKYYVCSSLRTGQDGVEVADVGSLRRLCTDFPKVKFLVTFLARYARKCQLMPVSVWCFCIREHPPCNTTPTAICLLGRANQHEAVVLCNKFSTSEVRSLSAPLALKFSWAPNAVPLRFPR